MTTAIAIPHLKMHGFAGDHLLERCEDAGCTVDERGNARCGRLACPSCGFSGSNVHVPAHDEGFPVAECSCGQTWMPRPASAAA